MKRASMVLCALSIFAAFVHGQSLPEAQQARYDYYDEALRLFGTASAGGPVTEHRALQGNRILYHKNGNLYPDERDVKYFSLDYTDKHAGDFSVCFDASSGAPVDELGFMPGPYQQSWDLSEDWMLRLWLKGSGLKLKGRWPLTFLDREGNRAEGFLTGFSADGRWHRLSLPLSRLRIQGDFDFTRVVACQLENIAGPGGKLWIDDIHFSHKESGEVKGVTDKSIEQRRAEAEASRAGRVNEAFLDISRYTSETLKLNDRHVYWRDLLNIHFGKLWLGQDIEETNAELREIFTSQDPEIRKEYELDGHWSLYLTPTLIQLYYTFGSKGLHKPGRLEKETEKALLDLLWERTEVKNDIHIARQSTWWMAGSENHDINAKVANLLSSQIFMNEPEYASRVYPDLGYGSGYGYGKAGLERQTGGRASLKDGKEYRARDHYEAWVDFWKEWFTGRAKRGLFIELNSPTYMLYSLGFLQNIYDLCEDRSLKERAGKFFDLVWADWAQDQIHGVRGGAKTRNYGQLSGYGSMTQFAKFLLGGPGNACHGFFELLLSDYSLPPLIWEMALDREGMGCFAYQSRRPGEEENIWPRPLGNERTLLCDTPSRFLRYSWVTPDYVLGTQMDHPAAVHSHLSVSRRYHSMIFTGDPYCRVIPGPLYSGKKPGLIGDAGFDESDPDSWKLGTDHNYRSVQHRRVMITQQSRNMTRISPEWFPDYDLASKPYGILFDGDYDRREEKDGWIFVEKGNAYLAVRVITGNGRASENEDGGIRGKSGSTTLGQKGYHWNNDRSILHLEDKYSPVLFEAARKADYPTLKEFQDDILDNPLELFTTVMAPHLGFNILSYTGCGEDAREIVFNAANSEIPTVGGNYINYSYPQVFDSPYIKSGYESGVVKIRKEDQELVLDFNDPARSPNVVLIVADDVSPDFSCFNGQVYTPNIDLLAQKGVRFENAYVMASSCSPSRSSIITGRYPHNTGALELHMDLPEGHYLFPEALKEAGYYSVLAGKWHTGEATRKAFDLVVNTSYQTDPTGAAHWVECLEERPRDQPFFMWFASFDAHRPWEKDSMGVPYDPAKVILPPGVPDTPIAREDVASYYDEIQRFDRYVGSVVRELKRQGEYENTLIIILGDNGRPFPRNKTSLYEGGMKTPLIAHWPEGGFREGEFSKSLVSSIDIAPAILEAAGLPVPSRVQGESLLPVCREPDTEIHEFIFGERNWHAQRACGRMVRRGDFVYIRDFTPGYYSFQMVDHNKGSYAELLRLKKEGKLSPEQTETFSTNRPEEMLFNVATDPHQLVNLVGKPEYEDELEILRKALAEWQHRTGDSIPPIDELTPDRHDRISYERLYPGSRPPTGTVPGERAGAMDINEK